MMLFDESSLVSPASSPSSAVFFLLAGLKIIIHLLNNNNNNNSKYNPLLIRQGCYECVVCDGRNKSSTKHVGREEQT